MAYTIFKAEPPSCRSGNAKYPFAQMQPGEAFSVPNDRGYNETGVSRVANNLRYCAHYYRTHHEPLARFSVRTEGDHVTVYRKHDAKRHLKLIRSVGGA